MEIEEMRETKPELSPHERKQVREYGAPPKAVIHEIIYKEGELELDRTFSALVWSGLAAGLSMGFSLVIEGLLRSHLPDTEWRELIAGFGYTAGFLIIILGRQQLFTENTLTVMLPLLSRKNVSTFLNVLRVWTVVLIANLGGAFLFAFVIAQTGIFDPEVKTVFDEIGREALKGDWTTIFLKGIFAGWLIALMVWLLPAAESARIWVVIVMTYFVALGGYPHIIAGSVEVMYAAIRGAADWSAYLGWMLPTLFGNICGGVLFVAVLEHAQVAHNKRNRTE